MSAEAWIALTVSVVGLIGSIIGSAVYFSWSLSSAMTTFKNIGTQQAAEINDIKMVMKGNQEVQIRMSNSIERAIMNQERNDDRFKILGSQVEEVKRDIYDLRRGRGLIDAAE